MRDETLDSSHCFLSCLQGNSGNAVSDRDKWAGTGAVNLSPLMRLRPHALRSTHDGQCQRVHILSFRDPHTSNPPCTILVYLRLAESGKCHTAGQPLPTKSRLERSELRMRCLLDRSCRRGKFGPGHTICLSHTSHGLPRLHKSQGSGLRSR